MAEHSQPDKPVSHEEVALRYLNDAVFHARVETIVQEMEVDHNVRFDKQGRSLVTAAVARALLTAERDT